MDEKNQLPENIQRLYDFIQSYIADMGYAPSVRDIGAALDIPSTSTVHARLKLLEESGHLRRDPSRPRAMVIRNSPSDTAPGKISPEGPPQGLTGHPEQPLIPAGTELLPYIPFEEVGKAFSIPEAAMGKLPYSKWSIPDEVLKGGPCFVTTMPDDSMVNRQVYEGDYLIVRRQDTAENSDMIIGSWEQQILIRSYTKGLRQVRLQVESNDFLIATIDPEELTIYGVVIGCLHLWPR